MKKGGRKVKELKWVWEKDKTASKIKISMNSWRWEREIKNF